MSVLQSHSPPSVVERLVSWFTLYCAGALGVMRIGLPFSGVWNLAIVPALPIGLTHFLSSTRGGDVPIWELITAYGIYLVHLM